VRPQRRLHRLEWPGGGVEFHPSHGDWVRVLGANEFVVEALHELYAPAGAPTHAYYDIATARWASRWPVEDLWAARLRSPMGYEPSRPTSWTRWTASLREEAPSLR
jgi:hypothetical protein